MAPVECTEEEAQHFKRQHGDNVVVYADDDGVWHAVFKKGAQLYIPKALKFDRLVAGQIPTGWDARRYGVPEDIVQQVRCRCLQRANQFNPLPRVLTVNNACDAG
jgi:fatty acid synthase subunit beta